MAAVRPPRAEFVQRAGQQVKHEVGGVTGEHRVGGVPGEIDELVGRAHVLQGHGHEDVLDVQVAVHPSDERR